MAETPFNNPNVAQRHNQTQTAGFNTPDGDIVGLTAQSLVGFYGATPVAQQSISLGSGTLAQLITALGNTGLLNVTA